MFINAKIRAFSITLVPLATAVARAAAFHGTGVLITQKIAAAVWSAVRSLESRAPRRRTSSTSLANCVLSNAGGPLTLNSVGAVNTKRVTLAQWGMTIGACAGGVGCHCPAPLFGV